MKPTVILDGPGTVRGRAKDRAKLHDAIDRKPTVILDGPGTIRGRVKDERRGKLHRALDAVMDAVMDAKKSVCSLCGKATPAGQNMCSVCAKKLMGGLFGKDGFRPRATPVQPKKYESFLELVRKAKENPAGAKDALADKLNDGKGKCAVCGKAPKNHSPEKERECLRKYEEMGREVAKDADATLRQLKDLVAQLAANAVQHEKLAKKERAAGREDNARKLESAAANYRAHLKTARGRLAAAGKAGDAAEKIGSTYKQGSGMSNACTQCGGSGRKMISGQNRTCPSCGGSGREKRAYKVHDADPLAALSLEGLRDELRVVRDRLGKRHPAQMAKVLKRDVERIMELITAKKAVKAAAGSAKDAKPAGDPRAALKKAKADGETTYADGKTPLQPDIDAYEADLRAWAKDAAPVGKDGLSDAYAQYTDAQLRGKQKEAEKNGAPKTAERYAKELERRASKAKDVAPTGVSATQRVKELREQAKALYKAGGVEQMRRADELNRKANGIEAESRDVKPVGDEVMCPNGHPFMNKLVAGFASGRCATCGEIPAALLKAQKEQGEKAHKEYTEREIAAMKRAGAGGYSSKRG